MITENEFNNHVKTLDILFFTDLNEFLPFIAESSKYHNYIYVFKESYDDSLEYLNKVKPVFVYSKNNRIVFGIFK